MLFLTYGNGLNDNTLRTSLAPRTSLFVASPRLELKRNVVIYTIFLLTFFGMLLSAFFSGTETGFYRVSRVRLLLDGLAGDLRGRGLLWLTNYPTVFVAITLIGNNLANYLVSRGLVLATVLIVGESFVAQALAPVIFAPIIFVYGELLPKNLCYHMPNRLLRAGAPLFFAFGLVLSPLVAILWLFGRFLNRLVGESPERVRLMLARKELARVLDEGQQAGILQPAQLTLAQSLFSIASEPAVRFVTPLARIVSIREGMSTSEVLRLARRHRLSSIPVESSNRPRQLKGYIRIVDLRLNTVEHVETIRPLLEVPSHQSLIEALMRMQSSREMVARVVDGDSNTIGLLHAAQIIQSLMRGD